MARKANQGEIAYPEIAAAENAHSEARAALKQAMRQRFPAGARVRVVHYRGEFTGTVKHTDECRVFVENDKTGKVSGRYPLLDTNGRLSVAIID